jgi:four helix bundle protein
MSSGHDGNGVLRFETSFLGEGGFESTMTSSTHSLLPHHRLRAYGVALEFLRAVRAAKVRDRDFRDQALRSAKSACRNCAEATGRVGRADKARVFGIARGETIEAICCVEIAVESGDADPAALPRFLERGSALYAMLTALSRAP